MKCPHCGAWSDVLSTRGAVRRRQCANGHRFTTREVVTSHTPRKTEDRDKQIAARVVDQGEPPSDVAVSFGIGRAQVSRIVRRLRPEHNQRSVGSLRMWAAKKGKT